MIVIEGSERYGSRKGRCDAHCYKAKGQDCHCVCGGKNHGVGLKRAMQNSFELFVQSEEFLSRPKIAVKGDSKSLSFCGRDWALVYRLKERKGILRKK